MSLTPYTMSRHRRAVEDARRALITALRDLDAAETRLAEVEAPPPPPKAPTRQRAATGRTKKTRKKTGAKR